MPISSAIGQLYWAFLILSPLGYALLNSRAFKETGMRYLIYIVVLDLILFATTLLMFLIRYSDLVRGDIRNIQTTLFVIAMVRIPSHMYFYARLLRDLPAQETSSEDDEL
jgi:hypothetical protein